MTSRSRYWIRILLANGAAALTVAAITSTLAAGNFGRELRYALVYANTIGTLMGVVMPWVAHRYWDRGTRARWAFLLATMVVLTAAGTLLATLLLFAGGIVPSRFFWSRVIGSFRIGLVLALIIGIAVTVYETIMPSTHSPSIRSTISSSRSRPNGWIAPSTSFNGSQASRGRTSARWRGRSRRSSGTGLRSSQGDLPAVRSNASRPASAIGRRCSRYRASRICSRATS